MSMLQENMHEHPHEHPHEAHAAMGPFEGSPKTMFVLGLFVGVAVCMALALGFVVWSITSGKGLSLGGSPQQQVAQAPSPTAQQPTQPTAPSQPVKPLSAADHVRGAKNAKVTLIEYSDFECPFCKSIEPTLEQALKDYPNDVQIAYRHYPLSFHQNAHKEAEASECVAELGGNSAFWAFHDKIFERTTSNGLGFALDALGPLAKEVGVDQTAFQKCLDSGKYANAVDQSESEGAAAGVEGTPATFVNGTLVSGAVPYSQFKQIIDSALKK